jgi:hypothetical protein
MPCVAHPAYSYNLSTGALQQYDIASPYLLKRRASVRGKPRFDRFLAAHQQAEERFHEHREMDRSPAWARRGAFLNLLNPVRISPRDGGQLDEQFRHPPSIVRLTRRRYL